MNQADKYAIHIQRCIRGSLSRKRLIAENKQYRELIAKKFYRNNIITRYNYHSFDIIDDYFLLKGKLSKEPAHKIILTFDHVVNLPIPHFKAVSSTNYSIIGQIKPLINIGLFFIGPRKPTGKASRLLHVIPLSFERTIQPVQPSTFGPIL